MTLKARLSIDIDAVSSTRRRRQFLSLMSLSLIALPAANATSTVATPEVKVFVRDVVLSGLGTDQIFVVPAAPARPLAFGASVARTLGSLPCDVYFGVIVPGGRVFTWIPKVGGGAVLVAGMSPVARAIADTTFQTSSAFAGDPQYTFSEGDIKGLYSLFVLLVPPGADPSDARRWTWVTTVPLMFQGMANQSPTI